MIAKENNNDYQHVNNFSFANPFAKIQTLQSRQREVSFVDSFAGSGGLYIDLQRIK